MGKEIYDAFIRKVYGRIPRLINYQPSAKAPEHKFFDRTQASTALAAVTAVTGLAAGFTLNFIAQGTDNVNRIGRKITMKSVQYKFLATLNAAATGDVIRYVIAWVVGGAAGVLPDISALYVTDQNSGFVFSSRNLNNTDDIKVLKEGTFQLSQTGDAGGLTNGVETLVEGFIPLDNVSQFGTTVASVATNGALGMWWVGTLASNMSTVEGFTRVRFTDT